MTDHSASTPKKLPKKPCAYWNCPNGGALFQPLYPGQLYDIPECAAFAAAEKAELRKARNKSGAGSTTARKKEAEHHKFIAEETAKEVASGVDRDGAAARALAKLKKERPELDFGPQHGLSHHKPLRPGDPRITRAIELADKSPRFSWLRLAELVDGTDKTASRFSNYHAKCLKGLVDDPTFVEAIDAAMARSNETIEDAAYQEAVVGKQVPIVSMGQVIAHEHVRDTKLLAQLLKVSNKEFARANSAAGSNLQINITNGAAMPNPDDENNPVFHFTYYETLALSEDERRSLSAIATKIISARKQEPVTVDLEPDARTRILMNEAREVAEDVEDLNDV